MRVLRMDTLDAIMTMDMTTPPEVLQACDALTVDIVSELHKSETFKPATHLFNLASDKTLKSNTILHIQGCKDAVC